MRLGSFEINFKSRKHQNKERKKVLEFGDYGGIEYMGDLILRIEALEGTSTNRYLTRESQTAETVRKYRGQAAKGNILVRNILESRNAFTVGRGLNVVGWDGAEKEFIQKFFEENRFNLAYLRRLGRERCFEGQVLLVLLPSPDGIPRIRFISWLDTRYEIKTNPLDYSQINYVRWLGDSGRDVELSAGQTAFMKFNTRLNSTFGTPLFAGILNQIEDLDDALSLIKSINNVAAKPTPHFEFASEDDANAFQDRLTSLNWKMGDPLASGSKASMLQLGYGPYSSIENHITILVKIISGHTSVPPHYFGFADLLANRSTSEDIRSWFVAISETETDEWGAGITDLVGRAMAMYNAATGSTLKLSGGRRIELEVIDPETFEQVARVWLPLYQAGAIDLETLLSKVPSVNEKEISARLLSNSARRSSRSQNNDLPLEQSGGSEGESVVM